MESGYKLISRGQPRNQIPRKIPRNKVNPNKKGTQNKVFLLYFYNNSHTSCSCCRKDAVKKNKKKNN